MRRMIKQSLLRFGGYQIAQNLYAQKERYRLISRFHKFLKTGRAPLPDMVMFELTQRCNLRCEMCYQDRSALAKRGELSLEQIVNFFDSTPYIHNVTLIGGEIFIRQDAIDLIRYLNRTKNIVICTNGTLMGDSEIEVLRSCHRIVTVCISLDAPECVHDAIRHSDGAYQKTVRAIRALSSFLPVTVNCVIQNENIDVLPELIDICAALGAKKLKFELERIFTASEIAKTMDENRLESCELSMSWKGRTRSYSLETLQNTLRECESRGKQKGIYIYFDPPYLMDHLEDCYSGRLRARKQLVCRSFRRATIAPNGNLINCYAVRNSFGNILDAPFEQIWNSESARGYRQQLIETNLTPVCENCPHMTAINGNTRINLDAIDGNSIS